MRVGLVVTGGADRSGRERVIPALLWLIERLARLHDVHVFALHHDPDPSAYPLLGATIHNLGHASRLSGLRRIDQRQRLRNAINRIGGLDVLHAYWGGPAIVAAPVAAELSLPFIVTADSGEFVSIPDIAYGMQRRWTDRRALAAALASAKAVTVCTTFMQTLARKHGVGARVIPLGIPNSYGSRDGTRPMDGPPWRLMQVASINPVKDHGTLLDAMTLIVKRGIDIHLDVVGADVSGGGVQTLASRLDLDARVTFRGFQTSDGVEQMWPHAHLHVVSSRHEAAGVVTLEAAMAGVPTVGTSVGYIADGASRRAVAVPVQNPSALADAISATLHDAPRRSALALAARQWTIENDADRSASAFDRLYREVTNA